MECRGGAWKKRRTRDSILEKNVVRPSARDWNPLVWAFRSPNGARWFRATGGKARRLELFGERGCAQKIFFFPNTDEGDGKSGDLF